jgi:ribonuclease P protein component
MGPFSFRKEERLCQRKQIQELFERGSSFYVHPFRVYVMRQSGQVENHQVLISVPTRIFKKAVDRNLVKRRIREAYRVEKHKLPKGGKLAIGLVYAAREVLPYPEIHQKLILVLGKAEKYAGPTNLQNNVLK